MNIFFPHVLVCTYLEIDKTSFFIGEIAYQTCRKPGWIVYHAYTTIKPMLSHSRTVKSFHRKRRVKLFWSSIKLFHVISCASAFSHISFETLVLIIMELNLLKRSRAIVTCEMTQSSASSPYSRAKCNKCQESSHRTNKLIRREIARPANRWVIFICYFQVDSWEEHKGLMERRIAWIRHFPPAKQTAFDKWSQISSVCRSPINSFTNIMICRIKSAIQQSCKIERFWSQGEVTKCMFFFPWRKHFRSLSKQTIIW